MIALVGGVIGCIAVLPVNGITTGTIKLADLLPPLVCIPHYARPAFVGDCRSAVHGRARRAPALDSRGARERVDDTAGALTSPSASKRDTYGRYVYIDTRNSVYGPLEARRRQGAPPPQRCLLLQLRAPDAACLGYPDSAPRGQLLGDLHRVTVMGPGVTPDVQWGEGAPLGLYDTAQDAVYNALFERLVGTEDRAVLQRALTPRRACATATAGDRANRVPLRRASLLLGDRNPGKPGKRHFGPLIPEADRPGNGYDAGLAGVAQLVEHQLPKLRVVGSSPIARFWINAPLIGAFCLTIRRSLHGAVSDRQVLGR